MVVHRILWAHSVFLPRIRSNSANRANAQASAAGQIVDTVSNIGIVKLFANARQEDNAALCAFEDLRGISIEYIESLTRF